MSTPGVVERASKEISRRIHSLGFKSKRAKSDEAEEKAKAAKQQQEHLTESDKLNGNNAPSDAESSVAGAIGSITKGSVMEKVTHVFGSTMGNSNNKAAAAGGADPTNGINIPKGAVANGRAKFESAQNPEKPMRFFGSRSRTNSPMLPVKTPKVPPPPVRPPTPPASQSTSEETTPEQVPTAVASTTATEKTTLAPKTLQTTCAATTTSPEMSKKISKIFPNMKRFVMWDELWQDYKFLVRFFRYFSSHEHWVLSQVCQRWREVLYQPGFWKDVRPILHCRTMRTWVDNEPIKNEMKQNFFLSLKLRGFESLVLLHANDSDVFDFIQNFPHGAKHLHTLSLRGCNISDRGLEALMEFLQGLYQLEICGCNEVTEQGLWSSLHPRLVSLTISDCINVADECICAVTQLLPSLYEFNLQAYHVTDSALSYFSPKQTGTLSLLRLNSCWEITNHGVVNIVHTLPNLTVLSLSGCSKITDDGIELIAENLRKLRSLDVSWCPRVTDAALEYIACDLNHLEELTLDRCVHITDIGIGYISTMLALHTLYVRWCTQIRDFGLQHICGMRSMQVLSVAGCSLLTSSGLSNLVQLRHLRELELTNCPGATCELIEYLRQNLPSCLVVD